MRKIPFIVNHCVKILVKYTIFNNKLKTVCQCLLLENCKCAQMPVLQYRKDDKNRSGPTCTFAQLYLLPDYRNTRLKTNSLTSGNYRTEITLLCLLYFVTKQLIYKHFRPLKASTTKLKPEKRILNPANCQPSLKNNQ